MNISAITLHPIMIPRHNGFQSKHVIVQMETTEGLTGWGEMSDLGHLPAYMPNISDLQHTLNANLVGDDALRRIDIERKMLELFPESNMIYDMSMVIRTGISLALFDLAGKHRRCSASQLLGGGAAGAIPIAYSIFRQATEQDLRDNLQLVEEQVKRGFVAFHIYVGLNPELEIDFVAELHSKYGGRLQLSIDGSNLLSWQQSLNIARRLDAYNILYYESPALKHDLEGTANFHKRASMPTSEHIWSMAQIKQAIKLDCLDIMNITLTFAGGMEYALKLLHVAETFGKSLVVGTTQELSIGSSAQAHFASVASNCAYACHITGPLLYASDVVESPVQYRDGCLVVPQGDGLGINVDARLLEQARAELLWGAATVASVTHRR